VAAVTSGGATDRSALDRVAAMLSSSAREEAERLAAGCRETAFARCGESAGP
jgi:hypothetical protein